VDGHEFERYPDGQLAGAADVEWGKAAGPDPLHGHNASDWRILRSDH
jgi:hypothetical protein